MKVRQYGRTGLFVPELSIGTASFGATDFSRNNPPVDEEAARRQVAIALDAGANLFDTADGYAKGNSELFLGRALKSLGIKRRDVLISTKAGLATGPGANHRGASRANLVDAVTASLERLGVDHIDIYHVHLPDTFTPIEETARALEDIATRGFARYLACSNWRPWRIMKAIGLAERNGWRQFDGVEAYYSLVGRDIERELVTLLKDEGLGLLAYSPQARGLLSGTSYSGTGPIPVPPDRLAVCLQAMRGITAARGISLSRLAVAWALAKPFVSSVIIGASSEAQLKENLRAAEVALTGEETSLLDQASALAPEYPEWLEPFAVQQRTPKNRNTA
jgi:aryl-alcohol dehydrogenase-like predicted oxidoreductase